MDERPIPEAATLDQNSMELARIWLADRSLVCSMRIGFYEDRGINEPDAWGIILADIAKHVSNGLQDRYGSDPSSVMRAIKMAFDNELEKSTSHASGHFSSKS